MNWSLYRSGPQLSPSIPTPPSETLVPNYISHYLEDSSVRKEVIGDPRCPTWSILKRPSCRSVLCVLWPSGLCFLNANPLTFQVGRSKNSSIQSLTGFKSWPSSLCWCQVIYISIFFKLQHNRFTHFGIFCRWSKEYLICIKIRINIDNWVQIALLCCFKKHGNIDNGCMINVPLCHSH